MRTSVFFIAFAVALVAGSLASPGEAEAAIVKVKVKAEVSSPFLVVRPPQPIIAPRRITLAVHRPDVTHVRLFGHHHHHHVVHVGYAAPTFAIFAPLPPPPPRVVVYEYDPVVYVSLHPRHRHRRHHVHVAGPDIHVHRPGVVVHRPGVDVHVHKPSIHVGGPKVKVGGHVGGHHHIGGHKPSIGGHIGKPKIGGKVKVGGKVGGKFKH